MQSSRSARDRFASAVTGAVLAIGTFGLTALMSRDLGRLPFVFLLCMCAYLVIGCFGLNQLIQALRGAPRKSGFFYRALAGLSWVRPAVLSVGIPVLLALVIAGSAATHEAEGLLTAQALGMVWVAFIVNVAVHELGHLAAARLVGIAPHRIVIGPAECIRTARGWRPRLCPEWFSLIGGLIVTEAMPPPTARQLVVIAAGGPAGTLSVLIAFLALNPYRSAELVEIYKPGPALVVFGALGAIVTLAFSLLPTPRTPAGHASDGYVIRQNFARLRKR